MRSNAEMAKTRDVDLCFAQFSAPSYHFGFGLDQFS